ncbi:MAG: hypothetical protein V4692_01920 [Bdellovibrionota bacterium]
MKRFIVSLATLLLAFANPTTAFAANQSTLFNRIVEVKRDANGKLVELSLKAKAGLMQSESNLVTKTLISELSNLPEVASLSNTDMVSATSCANSKKI